MEFEVFEYTGRGAREVNEDNVGHGITDKGGVFLVADGLGGHSLGEVASKRAVDTILESVDELLSNPEEEIEVCVKKANEAILDVYRQYNKVLKSTLALLVVKNEQIFLANVGDSRVYMIRDGRIVKYTDDHSVAYKKYKAGEITREELGFDEDQSSLLRTLGNEERYEPTIHNMNMAPQKGDAFLLCSDGFWEYVKDLEMTVDLTKSKSAKEWAEKLLLRAIDRVNSDNDNITVQTILVK